MKKGGDGGLIQKIADLVHDKKIPEISDIRDESDRNGMRLVIELKRDALPKVVLNKLYKHTPMQTTFGVNTVALVDGVPQTLALREVIDAYVRHQREVVVRRTKHELGVLEARVHILEGLLIALDNLDAIIDLIRASRDRENARGSSSSSFGLTRDPGVGDPRPAPRPAHRARVRRDQDRSTPTRPSASASCARSSATRAACSRSSRRSCSRSPSASPTSGARRSRPPRTRSTSRT